MEEKKSNMMNEEHIPVLIVGGGIVGLSASLFLSHQGIPSLLVERHPGTSIHPRARGVNARTMELYRELGIDEAVRAAGADLAPSRGIYQGRSLVEVIEARPRKEGQQNIPGAKFFANIGPVAGSRGTQDRIEPVLLAAARKRGGDLRFHTECIALEQDEDEVRATVCERMGGTLSLIHANYLLAADGAGSPIRQMLGVSTSGRGSLGYLLNILFRADLRELVRGREFSLCLIERPEVRGLFTSINNSDSWVFHLPYHPAQGEKTQDFSHERCKELVRLALGIPEVELEIKSILPWESAVRVADGFQHGRVFLAGDAAHQMPPWGGQGANTGIADAHNLAWKLAAVLQEKAAPALLTTYDVERRPVGRVAAEESGAAADKDGLLSMRKSLPLLPGLLRRIPRLLGYGYEYTSQAIIADGTSSSKGIWRQLLSGTLGLDGRPGTRAPHVWVEYQGQRISTLDMFGKSFVLLAGPDGTAWSRAAETLAARLDIDLIAHCVGPAGDLFDQKSQWKSRAGISAHGAVLIRPDGFVAWRAREQPPDILQELEHVLTHMLYG